VEINACVCLLVVVEAEGREGRRGGALDHQEAALEDARVRKATLEDEVEVKVEVEVGSG